MKKQPTDKLQVNILGMLAAVIGFGLLAVFLTIVLSAQDPLWFTTGFDVLPERIVIYQAGQRVELRSGQPGYTEMAEAVRACLAQGSARASGIGLSQGSLDDAFSLYLTVEAFFSQPVKLHAAFNTGAPNQMLFPITGRHSDQPVVFLGKNGTYMANGPVLKTVQPIRDALRSLGFYSEP
jgi:hypothetical protein